MPGGTLRTAKPAGFLGGESLTPRLIESGPEATLLFQTLRGVQGVVNAAALGVRPLEHRFYGGSRLKRCALAEAERGVYAAFRLAGPSTPSIRLCPRGLKTARRERGRDVLAA